MQTKAEQEVTQESDEITPNLAKDLLGNLQAALPGLEPDDAALITAVAWKLALWRNIEDIADGQVLTPSQRGEAPRRLMRMRHHLYKADTAAGRTVPNWIPIPDESKQRYCIISTLMYNVY